jgi:hypothetical protein
MQYVLPGSVPLHSRILPYLGIPTDRILMVFLRSWYVRMAFRASSIIPLSNQIPNGDFGVDPDSLIAYVVLAVSSPIELREPSV